jgi:small membrane protein
MIAQVLLTVCCIGFMLYGLGQLRETRLGGYSIVGPACAALWFVWHPDDSTRLASLVGIGRGADLLFYLWFVVSAALILVLHVKLGHQGRQIVKLARHIALAEARGCPGSGGNE